MSYSGIVMVFVLLAAGCSTLPDSRDAESQAAYHMRLAETLERASLLREATHEYTIVAEQYPSSTSYPAAVRKAAFLSMNRWNPAINDSVSLHWFNVYLGLPLKRQDREGARTYVYLLERIRLLREDITRQSAVVDSLSSAAKRQTFSLSSQTRLIQDLETELQQANDELKKLKEIDVRLSKTRGKK